METKIVCIFIFNEKRKPIDEKINCKSGTNFFCIGAREINVEIVITHFESKKDYFEIKIIRVVIKNMSNKQIFTTSEMKKNQ